MPIVTLARIKVGETMKRVFSILTALLAVQMAQADGVIVADSPIVWLSGDGAVGGVYVADSLVVALPDYQTRMKMRWYGTVDVSMDSDSDGDGYTFAEELENGTAPTFFDVPAAGGVRIADSQVTVAEFEAEDPSSLLPSDLKAKVGIDSVLLEWQPSPSSRVCGYGVYKTVWGSEEFDCISEFEPLPRYRDCVDVIQPYGYRVASVIRYYKPGNSEPTKIVTEPIGTVWADLGHVVLRWNDASGFVGDEIAVELCVENTLGLVGAGLVIELEYDEMMLNPVRVLSSGLTSDVAFGVDASCGHLRLEATGGEIVAGEGKLFTFVFKACGQGAGSTELSLKSVSMHSLGGALVSASTPSRNARVEIAIRPQGGSSDDPLIVVPYSRGDMNGDGCLTKEDRQLLAKLMNGGKKPKWTESQLKAGDYNGNGRLDQGDYQLLKADFREKGVK